MQNLSETETANYAVEITNCSAPPGGQTSKTVNHAVALTFGGDAYSQKNTDKYGTTDFMKQCTKEEHADTQKGGINHLVDGIGYIKNVENCNIFLPEDIISSLKFICLL